MLATLATLLATPALGGTPVRRHWPGCLGCGEAGGKGALGEGGRTHAVGCGAETLIAWNEGQTIEGHTLLTWLEGVREGHVGGCDGWRLGTKRRRGG